MGFFFFCILLFVFGVKMTAYEVSVAEIGHNRRNLTALIGAVLTSGMELTALRRICGTGKLALKSYGIGLSVGVSHGYC